VIRGSYSDLRPVLSISHTARNHAAANQREIHLLAGLSCVQRYLLCANFILSSILRHVGRRQGRHIVLPRRQAGETEN
jgi:hypothetical protein